VPEQWTEHGARAARIARVRREGRAPPAPEPVSPTAKRVAAEKRAPTREEYLRIVQEKYGREQVKKQLLPTETFTPEGKLIVKEEKKVTVPLKAKPPVREAPKREVFGPPEPTARQRMVAKAKALVDVEAKKERLKEIWPTAKHKVAAVTKAVEYPVVKAAEFVGKRRLKAIEYAPKALKPYVGLTPSEFVYKAVTRKEFPVKPEKAVEIVGKAAIYGLGPQKFVKPIVAVAGAEQIEIAVKPRKPMPLYERVGRGALGAAMVGYSFIPEVKAVTTAVKTRGVTVSWPVGKKKFEYKTVQEVFVKRKITKEFWWGTKYTKPAVARAKIWTEQKAPGEIFQVTKEETRARALFKGYVEVGKKKEPFTTFGISKITKGPQPISPKKLKISREIDVLALRKKYLSPVKPEKEAYEIVRLVGKPGERIQKVYGVGRVDKKYYAPKKPTEVTVVKSELIKKTPKYDVYMAKDKKGIQFIKQLKEKPPEPIIYDVPKPVTAPKRPVKVFKITEPGKVIQITKPEKLEVIPGISPQLQQKLISKTLKVLPVSKTKIRMMPLRPDKPKPAPLIQIQKPKVEERVSVRPITKPIVKPKVKDKEKLKPLLKPAVKVKYEPAERQFIAQMPRVIPKPKVEPKVKPKPIVKLITRPISPYKVRLAPTEMPVKPTVKKVPKKPFIPWLPRPKYLPPEKYEKGFEVEVKRLGRFEKITFAPVTKAKALQLGMKEVDITAAATFRLVPKGAVKAAKKTYGVQAIKLKRMFYEPKRKKAKTYIEKPKYRISTLGEVRGIPYKGLAAIQRKKRRGFAAI